MLDFIYISDEGKVLIYSLAVVSIIGALILSAWNNQQRLSKEPGALSYHWGFYFSWLNLIFNSGMTLAILWEMVTGDFDFDLSYTPDRNLVWLLMFFFFASVSSYAVSKRSRWAWIYSTLITLNPVLYAINFFYARRRWSTLRSGFEGFSDPFLAPFLLLPRTARIASSGWALWAISVIFTWNCFSLEHSFDDGALTQVLVFPPLLVFLGYLIVTKLWR